MRKHHVKPPAETRQERIARQAAEAKAKRDTPEWARNAKRTKFDGQTFRSKLEARHAKFFKAIGQPYEYERVLAVVYPIDHPDSFGKRYLPDFWLPSLSTFVEVKGSLQDRIGVKKYQALAKRVTSSHDDDVTFVGAIFERAKLAEPVLDVNCVFALAETAPVLWRDRGVPDWWDLDAWAEIVLQLNSGVCEHCDGTGVYVVHCYRCDGSGTWTCAMHEECDGECWSCGGSGSRVYGECFSCAGLGDWSNLWTP